MSINDSRAPSLLLLRSDGEIQPVADLVSRHAVFRFPGGEHDTESLPAPGVRPPRGDFAMTITRVNRTSAEWLKTLIGAGTVIRAWSDDYSDGQYRVHGRSLTAEVTARIWPLMIDSPLRTTALSLLVHAIKPGSRWSPRGPLQDPRILCAVPRCFRQACDARGLCPWHCAGTLVAQPTDACRMCGRTMGPEAFVLALDTKRLRLRRPRNLCPACREETLLVDSEELPWSRSITGGANR